MKNMMSLMMTIIYNVKARSGDAMKVSREQVAENRVNSGIIEQRRRDLGTLNMLNKVGRLQVKIRCDLVPT